jgi:LmbE family N-acetylglucosaminyl deacetylase
MSVKERSTIAFFKGELMRSKGYLAVILAISCALPVVLASIWVEAQSPRAVSDAPRSYAEPICIDHGSAALWQTLKKLHTRASLIMITAHPDDEDGGMLAYESRGQGARVTLLTLNRGEGGANVMSPDFFDALGLVRTEELLAADRYYGAQQYFTRVSDYGFSKSLQEAKEKWTVERVLYDTVRVIRLTRPLVVTSVFVGGPSDGHGNHQMAGVVAQLAYKEAGNPNIFPDQVRAGLRPWTPLKDYARVPFARPTSKGIYDYSDHHYYPLRFYDHIDDRWIQGVLTPTVIVPEGTADPLLGISYAQIARNGLGLQKSQNGGTGPVPPGPINSPYHRFASRVPAKEQESSVFSGIDTSLMGIANFTQGQDTGFLKAGLSKINALVEQAMENFSAQHPERIAPTLAQGLKATNNLIDAVASSSLFEYAKYNVTHELKVKQAQFNTALTEALGLSQMATVAPATEPSGMFARFFGILSPFRIAIPGQEFHVTVHVADEGSMAVKIMGVRLLTASRDQWTTSAEGPVRAALGPGGTRDFRFSVQVPEGASLTRPYFTRPNIEQSYYDVTNPTYPNLPLAAYPLSAEVEFSYNRVSLANREVVETAQRVTGPGLVLEPLVVGPAISVWIAPRYGVVPLGAQSFTVHAILHSNVQDPAQGTVRLQLPVGWQASSQRFSIAKLGEDQSLDFKVAPRNLQAKPYRITAVAEYNGREYGEGYRTVGYPGLRPYFLYRSAAYHTSGVDLKMASGLSVGYIMGSGDDVPQSLENLGITVHFLTSQDLASGNLSKYNVIVMGVRTYAVRNGLRTYNGRILNYVKNGGVVIVQYQTPEYDHDYGPFPYSMTNDPEEVTDEGSKVVILDSKNPIFTWPNEITPKDFDGWVEERGSKFMESWDPRYEALLETHDPDQAPQKGGLLYARYGKGVYIYNAYAFYRELPYGVPGAYRIFANMLSLPKNPNNPKVR